MFGSSASQCEVTRHFKPREQITQHASGGSRTAYLPPSSSPTAGNQKGAGGEPRRSPPLNGSDDFAGLVGNVTRGVGLGVNMGDVGVGAAAGSDVVSLAIDTGVRDKSRLEKQTSATGRKGSQWLKQ